MLVKKVKTKEENQLKSVISYCKLKKKDKKMIDFSKIKLEEIEDWLKMLDEILKQIKKDEIVIS